MMKTEELEIGTKITNEKYCVFFGNKNFNLQNFSQFFSNHHPISLHQIHSDVCIEAKPGFEQKADAHYSYEKNRALVIKTADCVPIFLYCKTTDTILAIHAGWRGLASEIIRKSIEKAFPFSKTSNLEVFVGPHIHQQNYEFSIDELNKIKSFAPLNFYTEKEGRYYLDLSAVYLHQFQQIGIQQDNIHLFNRDTYSEDQYYSYRKDQTKGRLFHFIFRIS